MTSLAWKSSTSYSSGPTGVTATVGVKGTVGVIVSVGVLHFFKDLAPVFSEARRLLADDGIFSMTISLSEDDSRDYEVKVDSVWNTPFTCHSKSYIKRLAGEHGFTVQKELTFYGYDGEMKCTESSRWGP